MTKRRHNSDFLYIEHLPPCERRKTVDELIKTPAHETIEDLAEQTGIDATPDPDVDFLVDLYIRPQR